MRKDFEERERISGFETAALLRRAIRYVRPLRGRFAVKLALLCVSLLPFLLLPWPVKIVIDHVIEAAPIGQTVTPYPFFVKPFLEPLAGASPEMVLLATIAAQAVLLLLIGAIGAAANENDRIDGYLAGGQDVATRTENQANAGFSLAGGLLGYFDFRWTIRLTQDLNHHYRSRLFERIHALPMTAFDDERIGDAVFRVMYDTPSITETCYRLLLTPIAAPLNIVLVSATIAIVYGDHPLLAFAGLAFIPLVFLATLPFTGLARRSADRARKAGATTTSTAEESLTNILAVQSLGAEAREQRRFDDDSWEGFSSFRGLLRVGILATLAGAIPGVVLGGFVFYYVTALVIGGELSPGDFAVLFTYFLLIVGACVDLGALWMRLQEQAMGLHRVFFLMDLPGERDHPGSRTLETVREGLRLEDVSLRYPDGTEALHGVSLEARVGAITALVGPAGAGKTSLAYLIPRFLSASSGHVRLDGIDVEELSLDSLREKISFVFQETVLFDDSVEENIRLGCPGASEADVRRAATIAGADEFIRRLPKGYQTRLGRSGGKLSVGQKQRLSIARALVRDAPVLILDEPTSALDPDTEQRLVAALREASRSRLVLVIAHRLSTVRAADEIVFLREGRILERGSHAELMARPTGAYRRFVDLQSRGTAS
ncbi:Putative multidrug export ATP-binding/permease protein [Myxococcaceae bacterium]|nr:Putative multidrug export ATP-binding/permease protein [Myxococcaceae bacterium]